MRTKFGEFTLKFNEIMSIFRRTSRTLRDATQITFLSATKDKENCVVSPIADQSQSAVGARHSRHVAIQHCAVLQLTD